MHTGLTSIIIPTFNHREYLADAIASALEQTALVEVIVVDDGSSDGTSAWLRERILHSVGARLRLRTIKHSGVATARNVGIDEADGEFVMFLDADDVIASDKVEAQLAEMVEGVGWVLCDVRIEDTSGKVEFASHRYNYAQRLLDNWLQPQLIAANFIPIMAPLIRREVLGAIRFLDRDLEDWHFWYAVAGVARCTYVPRALATYRKRSNGRNTGTGKLPPAQRPGVEQPLRLNLGCGTPLARSWHPMPGLVNLDRSLGWRFEDGLLDFLDGSVAGITVSHALMYVHTAHWPQLFAEFARVLQPGGILRITEDDTAAPKSRTYLRGWHDAVTLTNPAMMRSAMESVGFTVHDVSSEVTGYRDHSLMQAQHGAPPDVFFLEGVRECALLFSPHADDEALFAAFTIIRHKPRLVICFGSSGDYGDTKTRTAESRAAVAILGGGQVDQWDGAELEAKMRDLDGKIRPTRVWAPSPATSHPDHLAVALAAATVFGDRLTQYQTYDINAGGKVRAGEPVPFEAGWPELKRRALSCYRTQLAHPRARAFFEDDLAEYQA